jgi:hypothetical protein
MSADNGVYVLYTEGPEYRIAHMQAVDNLYKEFSPEKESWSPDVDYIVESFGKSKVYLDLTEALDAANMLEDQVGYTEYGTSLISEFKEYKFSDFEEQYNAKDKR